MKNIKLLLLMTPGLFLSAMCEQTVAQKKAEKADGADSAAVMTIVTAHSSDGIFSSSASYTYEIKNTYDEPETGKVSWVITDEYNKPLAKDSILVKINRKSSDSYHINTPTFKSGFYKINFMINVSDYDDTTKRVFGIKPDEIRSAHQKPADFDQFWKTAKDELAKIPPDFKATERTDLEKDKTHRVYVFEMRSIGYMTIRGYLTEPANQQGTRKFPVLLGLPGYQVALAPIIGKDDDLAVITLDVRGQGMSKDQLSVRKEDFIIDHIEDKNKYVMRGVIMDCVRAVDFIFSRPELQHDFIMATGGSMGGFLTLATAALDDRITICSAQNPIMSDIYDLNGSVEWPINHIKDYVAIKPGLTLQKVLDNLQYYDCKNFATTIKCPTLLGIGLLDPYVPPYNAYAVFNNVAASKKKIMVFRDLAHEVATKYKLYEVDWMNDTFGLF